MIAWANDFKDEISNYHEVGQEGEFTLKFQLNSDKTDQRIETMKVDTIETDGLGRRIEKIDKPIANEAKARILEDLKNLESTIANKLRILRAFDEDDSDSSAYDLHDQLFTMNQALTKFSSATLRASRIVKDLSKYSK